MQTTTACTTGNVGAAHSSATVVYAPATVGAAVGARVDTAAARNPCVGAIGCEPGVGSRSQGVGDVDRRRLGAVVITALRMASNSPRDVPIW
jgi:hypothetical protein